MILVTGGTGLVGSHLLFELARKEGAIRAIYRREGQKEKVLEIFRYYTSPEQAEKRYQRIEWFQADLNDLPATDEAFNGITHVYHCAALISFRSSDEPILRKTNIEGTANLVNLCIAHKVLKLCHVSSIASLGRPLKGSLITEETPWNPEADHSGYAISKYGGELEVWRASQEGVPVLIVNPGIILGPGRWDSGSGLFFRRVARGLKYYFTKTAGFVGVRDVARIMQLLMESEVTNDKFVLVAENLSFRTVLKFIAQSLHKPEPTIPVRPWVLWTAWFFLKPAALFGWGPGITSQMIKSLFTNSHYSNQKVRERLHIEFKPIKEVIEETGAFYQEALASGKTSK